MSTVLGEVQPKTDSIIQTGKNKKNISDNINQKKITYALVREK